MSPVPMTERETQRTRAVALNLHGLLAHWGEVASEAWVTSLLGWEEQERARFRPGTALVHETVGIDCRLVRVG
jgi:hypothetical protein